MRRFTLALTLALGSLVPGPVAAHPVTIDGTPGDWWGALPPATNLGRISRNAARQGEFVWLDATSDMRTTESAGLDLTQVRITADGTRLFIMAALGGQPVTQGMGAPQLQVAFDMDRFFGLGAMDFVDGARTQVTDGAAWEYLVKTGFGSGTGARLYDSSLEQVPATLTEAMSPSGIMEVSVPWSALGQYSVPTQPLRVTVALFSSAANDSVLETDQTGGSNVVDAISDYGAPGAVLSTTAEVSDRIVNDWRDLYFDSAGEIYSPVTISEVYSGGTLDEQWIEIYNASPGIVSLGDYKIGDEALPGGPQGMGRFPTTPLYSGTQYVVARKGAAFFSDYGFHADAECVYSDPATPDMLPDTAWAGTAAFGMSSYGDDVLILDGSNTVVDVFTFRNGSWPGVTAAPGVPVGFSTARSNGSMDTDNCATDFIAESNPSPGASESWLGVGTPPTGPSSLRVRGPFPNPFVNGVSLAIEWSGNDRLHIECEVLDVSGRRVQTIDPGRDAFAGTTLLKWDARDERGSRVTPGLYFLHVRTQAGDRTMRCVFMGP
jgi:hypothetical protein